MRRARARADAPRRRPKHRTQASEGRSETRSRPCNYSSCRKGLVQTMLSISSAALSFAPATLPVHAPTTARAAAFMSAADKLCAASL